MTSPNADTFTALQPDTAWQFFQDTLQAAPPSTRRAYSQTLASMARYLQAHHLSLNDIAADPNHLTHWAIGMLLHGATPPTPHSTTSPPTPHYTTRPPVRASSPLCPPLPPSNSTSARSHPAATRPRSLHRPSISPTRHPRRPKPPTATHRDGSPCASVHIKPSGSSPTAWPPPPTAQPCSAPSTIPMKKLPDASGAK